MADWYEVFDNDEVQDVTRRKVFVLARNLALTAGFAVVVFGFAQLGGVPLLLAMGLSMSIVIVAAVNTYFKLLQLHRIVWCLKISERRIAGYDYARRKIDLDWIKVSRIELAQSGLVVRGNNKAQLEVSHRYPDFARLSHRIVEYAEFYEIPVYIDGGRWQDVNVQSLYPFVESDLGGVDL